MYIAESISGYLAEPVLESVFTPRTGVFEMHRGCGVKMSIGGDLVDNRIQREKRYNLEVKKLKSLFNGVSEERRELCDRLIEEAAFLKSMLYELREDILQNGYMDEYKNGNNQFGKKKSVAADLYSIYIKQYAAIIKQLDIILPEKDMFNEMLGF